MKAAAIIWTLEGKITNKEQYKVAMETLTSKSFAEEGTKSHWWTVAEDGESFHVMEQYADADAAMTHLATWMEFGHLFTEATEISKFIVYSPLRDDLKEAVAGLNPIYMDFYGGFSK